MPFSIVLFEVKEKEIRLIKDAIVSSLRKGYEESEEGNILINYKNTKRTVVFYILINKHTKFIMKEIELSNEDVGQIFFFNERVF